jgi:urease accessory protein UreH
LDGERNRVSTGRINNEVGIGRAALGHCYTRCGRGQCGRDGSFGPAAVICDRYVQVYAFTAIHDAVAIAPGVGIVNGDGARIELGVAANAKVLRDSSAARGIDQN